MKKYAIMHDIMHSNEIFCRFSCSNGRQFILDLPKFTHGNGEATLTLSIVLHFERIKHPKM